MVLISAVVAAHRGYSDLWLVYLLATAGVFASDCLYCYLGRTRGRSLLEKRPKLARKVDWIEQRIDRRPTLVLLTYRYLYGFRTVTPLLLGNTSIPGRTFYLLSLLGVVVWAALITAFGTYLERLFGAVDHYEKYLFGGLLAFGLLYVAGQAYRGRYRRQVAVLGAFRHPYPAGPERGRDYLKPSSSRPAWLILIASIGVSSKVMSCSTR